MPGLCSYKQTDLVDMTKMHMMQHMMQKSTFHTKLISSQIFSEDILLKHSFSFDSNISLLHYHDMVLKKSTSSLVYLVNIKVISKIIMTRIAKSGLSFSPPVIGL